MGKTLMAEVERVVRASVEIDIEEFCANESTLRSKFGGTDEEYVRKYLDEEAYSIVRDGNYEGRGLRITEEWDETTSSILGIV